MTMYTRHVASLVLRTFLLVLLLATGCRSVGGTRGYPLFPNSGALPPRDEVALLRGPIATVDGETVSRNGMTFELLPGCHIAILQKNVGEGTAAGAWAANIGRLVVAFQMKAGHVYTVSSEMQDSSSPVGRVFITARERAPDGQTVRVPFAQSEADLEACRRWAAGQGLPAPAQ